MLLGVVLLGVESPGAGLLGVGSTGGAVVLGVESSEAGLLGVGSTGAASSGFESPRLQGPQRLFELHYKIW